MPGEGALLEDFLPQLTESMGGFGPVEKLPGSQKGDLFLLA
jgi:hypothetical protein